MLLNMLRVSATRVWQGSPDLQAGIAANPITDILPMDGGFYAVTRAGGFGLMRVEITPTALHLAQHLAIDGQPGAGQMPQISAFGTGVLVTGLPQGARYHEILQSGAMAAGQVLPVASGGGAITDLVAPLHGYAYGLTLDGSAILHWSGADTAAPAQMLTNLQTLTPPVIGPRAADFALRDLVRVDDLLIGAGAGQDALVTWRIAPNGALSAVAMVKAADLGMSGASAVEAITLAGQTYLALMGQGSSTLDILRLAPDGQVSAVDHIADSRETRFYQPGLIASASDGERAFIAMSGRDHGVSLFQLLPNGRLVHMFSQEDTLQTHLESVSALALDLNGQMLRLIAADCGGGHGQHADQFRLHPAATGRDISSACPWADLARRRGCRSVDGRHRRR